MRAWAEEGALPVRLYVMVDLEETNETLARDITAIPEDEIPTAQVVYTIIGGKIAFSEEAR